MESEEFMLLPVNQLIDIISSEELNVQSEELVFNAVMAWVRHNVAERRQHLSAVSDSHFLLCSCCTVCSVPVILLGLGRFDHFHFRFGFGQFLTKNRGLGFASVRFQYANCDIYFKATTARCRRRVAG